MWFEVRLLPTSEVDPNAILDILNTLHGHGSMFSFVIKSEMSEEGRIIRFFFEVNDSVGQSFKTFMRNTYRVEVIETAPPSLDFAYSQELHMRRHPAIPLTYIDEKLDRTAVDMICSVLENVDGAIVVRARSDRWGKLQVQSHLIRVADSRVSLRGSLFGQLFGVFQEMVVHRDIHDLYRETWWKLRQPHLSKLTEMILEQGRRKAMGNIFLANIMIYANSREDLLNISSAFPSVGLNSFTRFKRFRGVRMGLPSRRILYNAVRSLWWLPSVIILVLSYYLGFFNPMRLVSLSISDVVVLVFAVVIPILMVGFFKRYNPPLLASEELATIVNFPVSSGLKVALGRIAPPKTSGVRVKRLAKERKKDNLGGVSDGG